MIQDEIMKLQTYKMFEGDSDIYVERDDVLEVLNQQPCEDCISRQAVLDAFGLSEKTRKYGGDHSGYDTMMKYEIQDVIENLSPVTPQQKIGEWEIMAYDLYMCSKCYSKFTHNFKFCPNCGAKMERLRNDNSREK